MFRLVFFAFFLCFVPVFSAPIDETVATRKLRAQPQLTERLRGVLSPVGDRHELPDSYRHNSDPIESGRLSDIGPGTEGEDVH